MNYAAYTLALLEQVGIHGHQLEELGGRLDSLSPIEKTAAERSLQILAEAAIGCGKQYNRLHNLPDRNDAFQNLEQTVIHCDMARSWLPELKGAVGMRNAIVHDYLNLNWQLLAAVIKDGKYRLLIEFTQLVCAKLAK